MKKWLIGMMTLITSATVWAEKVAVGTVEAFRVDSHYHLILKDVDVSERDGKHQAYFLGKHKSFAGLIQNPRRYIGKRVRVYYHFPERTIPEAGGKVKIYEAIRLQWLTP